MILAALADWCCPRRALRWGPVIGYRDHLTHSLPPEPAHDPLATPAYDPDGDDLRGWPGPDGGLDL